MDLLGLSFNRQPGDIQFKPDAGLKLQAGEVVRGFVQGLTAEGLVQLLVRGKTVLAETQIPLQAGQELYLQADRMENGKVYLRAVDPQAQAELPELALRGMLTKLGLNSDALTAAVAGKLIAYNLPVNKDNIETVVKMAGLLPNSDGRALEAAAFVLSRGGRISQPGQMAALVEFFSSPQAREQLNQAITRMIQGDNSAIRSTEAGENRPAANTPAIGTENLNPRQPVPEPVRTVMPPMPAMAEDGAETRIKVQEQPPQGGRTVTADQQQQVKTAPPSAPGEPSKVAASFPAISQAAGKEPVATPSAVPSAVGTLSDGKPAAVALTMNTAAIEEPAPQVSERPSAPVNIARMLPGTENTGAANSKPNAMPASAGTPSPVVPEQPVTTTTQPPEAQNLSRLLTPPVAGSTETVRSPDTNLENLTRRLGELIKPALERLVTDLDRGKPDGGRLKQVIKEQQALLPDIKYARQVLETAKGTYHPLYAVLETLDQEWSGQALYNRLESNSLRDQSQLYFSLPLRWQERMENAEVHITWRRDGHRREKLTDSLTVNVGLNTVNLGTVIFHLRTQGRQMGLSAYLEHEEAKARVDQQMPELVAHLSNLGYAVSYMGSQVVGPPKLRPEFVDEAVENLPPITGLDLKI